MVIYKRINSFTQITKTMKKIALFFILSFIIISCTENNGIPPIDDNGNSNLHDTTFLNVSYGDHARQKYDIHLPAGRDDNTPVIVVLHGGAWKEGQKEDMNGYVNLIKKKWKNVAVMNMNYRLASNENKIHHPEIMSDIKAAIGHVLNKQKEYHISKNMGIMGASAGGQLAMIYAYKYNDHKNINCAASIFGPTIINDWEWYNSVNLWLGAYVGDILTEYVGLPWNDDVYESVSPYWNITSESQPTIIFHGSADVIVPVYQSHWMHGKLKELNVPTEYHEYFASHGFNDTQNEEVVSKMVTFFEKHIKK